MFNNILAIIKNIVKMRKQLSFVYSTSQNKQKFFFLFGAPGVGKGTYAKMLKKDLNFNHISTGD